MIRWAPLITGFLMAHSGAYASELPWQPALVASSVKAAIEAHLEEQRLEPISGLIHALALREDPEADSALAELVNYNLGESRSEDFLALVVNRGEPIVRFLRAQLDATCAAKSYCLKTEVRDARVNRMLELIANGEKIELVP